MKPEMGMNVFLHEDLSNARESMPPDVVADIRRLANRLNELAKKPSFGGKPFSEATSEGSPGQPETAKRLIAERRTRMRFFDSELFGEPAWDIMLDLYIAHRECRNISVSSLTIASGVPATTALRRIQAMTVDGIIVRAADEHDKRRIFVTLSPAMISKMDSFLSAVSVEPAMNPLPSDTDNWAPAS
jgi:DNA-binding MarR family transcriptional regulator